jgi:pilus assembly protein TadC
MTVALGVNDRVNEPLGIAVQLKVMSEVVDFLSQMLSVLAYGGSSVVDTLNQFSFHMGRVARFEVEIPANMSGFSVDLCD